MFFDISANLAVAIQDAIVEIPLTSLGLAFRSRFPIYLRK
jgi:hypothetical protein